MALMANRIQLVRYLQVNGHLMLEGDESVHEMREAIFNLRSHTQDKCMRPELGIPIVAVIPGIERLAIRSTDRERKTNMVTSEKYL